MADIRGTSPRVWNAWKAKLLEDLFHATRARLTGRAATASLDDSLEARRVEAARQLRLYAIPEGAERALWSKLDSVYFQRHTADEIAWHARQLYFRVAGQEPVVRARLSRSGAGLQVMIYLPDQKELFARICGFLGRARLSILDAKVHTTGHGYALDTFMVHDPVNAHAAYRAVTGYIEFELKRLLAERAPLEPPPIGRMSRHLKHFPLTPEVRLFPDDKGTHYILEIVAGDRPGLLARSPIRWPRPTSTSPAPRSTPWGSGRRTCSCSRAPGCTTRRRCCDWRPLSTSSYSSADAGAAAPRASLVD